MGGRLDPTVARARRFVAEAIADLGPGDRIVVALSGGADSLALAAVTAFVGEKAGLHVEAVVVDHGLQPGSDEVALAAVTQAEGLGLGASVCRVDVGRAGGPEAAARTARYAALAAAAGDAPVLLAHTLDDQAETVLLGLGRGSGPRSLSGMRPVQGQWRRPFLGLRRADTEQICRAHGLSWWVDPHNSDARFRRVRVRREVMPLLEDVLGGGVAEALARTAGQLAADSDVLDQLADSVTDTDLAVLARTQSAVRRRVLRRLAFDAGARELTAGHLAELERLVTTRPGPGRVELPGAVSAVRDGNRLGFIPTPVEC